MSTKLPTLEQFIDVIKNLPLKGKYTKEELLIPELLVEQQGVIELYYAAHNESFNPKAKIFMIGITPGFMQMEKSIAACKTFPTFVKGKNYTGHSPELIKNEWLMGYVRANMDRQVEMLPNALYVPMGRCVEEVLKLYIQEGHLNESQCLIGFPHPSGANVNRKKQFEEEKEQMMNKVKQFYS